MNRNFVFTMPQALLTANAVETEKRMAIYPADVRAVLWAGSVDNQVIAEKEAVKEIIQNVLNGQPAGDMDWSEMFELGEVSLDGNKVHSFSCKMVGHYAMDEDDFILLCANGDTVTFDI